MTRFHSTRHYPLNARGIQLSDSVRGRVFMYSLLLHKKKILEIIRGNVRVN